MSFNAIMSTASVVQVLLLISVVKNTAANRSTRHAASSEVTVDIFESPILRPVKTIRRVFATDGR